MIKTEIEAFNALTDVEEYLASHWKDGYKITLSKEGILRLQNAADSIVMLAGRMERLVKP